MDYNKYLNLDMVSKICCLEIFLNIIAVTRELTQVYIYGTIYCSWLDLSVFPRILGLMLS